MRRIKGFNFLTKRIDILWKREEDRERGFVIELSLKWKGGEMAWFKKKGSWEAC